MIANELWSRLGIAGESMFATIGWVMCRATHCRVSCFVWSRVWAVFIPSRWSLLRSKRHIIDVWLMCNRLLARGLGHIFREHVFAECPVPDTSPTYLRQ